MKHLVRTALAALLIAAPTLSLAQQFPTVPTGTVIGRTQIGTGPAQAIPFSQLLALLLQSSPDIPTLNTNSIVFKGSTSGQATVQAQAVAGTPSLNLPNTSGTIPSNATSPIVLDPASGTISCPTCATTVGESQPVVASRAAAQTLNLSGLSSVKTLGYAAAGDGGGATFKQITGNFLDSFVSAQSISNAGTGCTNGTYTFVHMTGGNGTGFYGTAVVSGGVMSSFTIGAASGGGNAYRVGDVLTVPTTSGYGGAFTCSGSQPTITVTGVSTPSGSFTDSVGDKFQIVVDQGNVPNCRQFGCVLNYDPSTGDSAATNDQVAIQNGLNFAAFHSVLNSGADTAGHTGNTFLIPAGSGLVCNGLIVPVGVTLKGVGPLSSTLKQCDADAATQNFITLCDPTALVACFGTSIKNIRLYHGSGTANAAVAMIFTNAAQQLNVIDNVAVYSGNRTCLTALTGYGGASNFIANVLFCTIGSSGNPGIILSYTAAVMTLRDSIVEAGSITGNALDILNAGGVINIDGFHTEGISQPIFFNVASGIVVNIKNVTGASGSICTDLITLQSGSETGGVLVEATIPGNCTHTVNNKGSFTTGGIVGPQAF